MNTEIDVESLVRRLAAILTELEDLSPWISNPLELESLADPAGKGPRSLHDENARRLLRLLLCAKLADPLVNASRGESCVLPALPGHFVINLSPLPGGGFDLEHVIKEPVIAWRVDSSGHVQPLVPGLPVNDQWAVLAPSGRVITDEYTNLFGDCPVPLRDWIRSEISWFELDMLGMPDASSSISARVFEFSGPLPRALWLMMEFKRDWSGSPEELIQELSISCGDSFSANLPSSASALLNALEEIETVLAEIGLSIVRIDDGRVRITRRVAGGNAQGRDRGTVQ